jgi:lipoyl(octanoyl) transferase
LRDYGEILRLQQSLRVQRREGKIPDTWLVGQHPAVITQGVRGAAADLVGDVGLPVFSVDRGGQTTMHNPGQLVIYPIVLTREGLLAQARLSGALLETMRGWIMEKLNILLEIPRGRPGLYYDQRKAASIGISIRGRVSMHGIAVNCCNDLAAWRSIIACGESDTDPITLSEIACGPVTPDDFSVGIDDWLGTHWGYGSLHKEKG